MKFGFPDHRYIYTNLVTALLAAKLLHLFSHLPTLPPFLFLLYLPTFLTLDAIVILSTWILAQRFTKTTAVLWFAVPSGSLAARADQGEVYSSPPLPPRKSASSLKPVARSAGTSWRRSLVSPKDSSA